MLRLRALQAKLRSHWRHWQVPGLFMVSGLLLFLPTTTYFKAQPAEQAPNPELTTVLPPPVAIVLAAGDPYLAADLQAIHAMALATKLDSPSQRALFARLLKSAMTLNPAHEDGYYLAQAILPWSGRVALNQRLQAAATAARPWDWLPPFFQGFNLFYFRKAPARAAPFVREAAQRTPNPKQRRSLQSLYAYWKVHGGNPHSALERLQEMVRGTQSAALRRELRGRIAQLQGLIKLRRAARAYRREHSTSPKRLRALLGYAGLKRLPQDPFGEGYLLNPRGHVVIPPPKGLQYERGGS